MNAPAGILPGGKPPDPRRASLALGAGSPRSQTQPTSCDAGERKLVGNCLAPRLLSILCVLSVALPVAAHPFATSSFEARTSLRGVDFDFHFDATSVVELVRRVQPTGPLGPRDAAAAEATILGYLDARFTLENEGARCARQPGARPRLEPSGQRVALRARWSCADELGTLVVRSTLFQDEGTPHELLGTLRHGAAVERYFFTGGERTATIRLAELRQVRPGRARSDGATIATPPPGAFARRAAPPERGIVTRFLGDGVVHVLGGLDHVLFVLSLLFAITSWKRLALVVTSFTLAHSLTLALGAFALLRIPPGIVEPLIALSIVYVALENLLLEQPRSRLGVTFAFGLVHGLGFAGALADLGLAPLEKTQALLAFNAGVELGQLAVVLPAFAALGWLRRHPARWQRARAGLCAATALVAAVWLVDRLQSV